MTRDTRKPASPGRAAALRALAVIVAAVSVLSQAAQVAHFLLVRHVVCVEHGDLIHEGESEGHSALARAEGGGDLAGVRAAPRSFGREHDHCAASSERRQRIAVLPQSSGVLPFAPESVEVGGASARRGAPPVPLLWLAPKHSPPV